MLRKFAEGIRVTGCEGVVGGDGAGTVEAMVVTGGVVGS